MGTGPFKFTGYTKGQSVTLTRNPDYDWAPATASHKGPAYLEKLTIRFLSQDATRVGALTSGQVQIADPIPPADVKTVKANQQLETLTTQAPGANYALVLNTTQKPLDDIRVRRAVQRGIDIDTAVKSVYFGVYKRAWSPISPTTPYYDKSLENTWGYDPALANRNLDEAGWTKRDADGYRTKGGKRLSIEWPLMPQEYIREQRDTLGQAIQADLKKLGIEIKRPRLDIGTYIEKVYAGKEGIATTVGPASTRTCCACTSTAPATPARAARTRPSTRTPTSTSGRTTRRPRSTRTPGASCTGTPRRRSSTSPPRSRCTSVRPSPASPPRCTV